MVPSGLLLVVAAFTTTAAAAAPSYAQSAQDAVLGAALQRAPANQQGTGVQVTTQLVGKPSTAALETTVRRAFSGAAGRVYPTRVVQMSVVQRARDAAQLGGPYVELTSRNGFCDAVRMVAALEEPEDQNFVRAHTRADFAEHGDERRSTTRIFGSKPGSYGAGILQVIESGTWRDDADLAEVYTAWGGFAYGRGLDGAPAREAMRDAHGRIEVAVKNVDSREHDILDSDDYYQYHGGMVATVRAVRGSEPAAYLGDSSDPTRVRVRTLTEETRRVFRARVANPRWIASMVRHGYKGAAELAATVDYLFGYDATTGVAEDWMYEQVAQRYLLDPDLADFMSQSNPWAARAIAERLLEAADRGMWSAPADDTLSAIRDRYLALEGELEEASAS